jgi:hypothetical protein
MKRISAFAALSTLLAAGFAQTQPPWPRLPETYSYSAKSEMMWPKSVHIINRNGAKELVGVRNESGDFHMVQLYDFQARKVYTRDLNAKTCTIQSYISPYAPVQQDSIAGWDELRRDMRKGAPPKVLRTEAVNGIMTKVVDLVIPDAGKYTYWLDEKFGFPVKQTVTLAKQPERLLMEMRELSYAPSPASLFSVPAECTRIGGYSSTTGGRAEVNVEASASATVQDGKIDATASAKLSSPTAARGKVTTVQLHLDPVRYQGPCPSPVKLIGDITTDGPATVWYEFLAGAVRKRGSGEGTLRFDRAGTQRITLDAEYVVTPSVPECLLLAAEVKEDGGHGPETVSSGPTSFNATCEAVRPIRK